MRTGQTVTDADIENYFNNHPINRLGGYKAKVVKVNSSFRLDEYEKQKSKVQTLKNQVKIQAGKEATALRKQFTKQQTMGNDSPVQKKKTEEEIALKKEQTPQSKATPDARSLKTQVSASDFSEVYNKMIHELNEEAKKVD